MRTIRLLAVLAFALSSTALLAGCPAEEPGAEGSHCHDDDECNDGLHCHMEDGEDHGECEAEENA